MKTYKGFAREIGVAAAADGAAAAFGLPGISRFWANRTEKAAKKNAEKETETLSKNRILLEKKVNKDEVHSQIRLLLESDPSNFAIFYEDIKKAQLKPIGKFDFRMSYYNSFAVLNIFLSDSVEHFEILGDMTSFLSAKNILGKLLPKKLFS